MPDVSTSYGDFSGSIGYKFCGKLILKCHLVAC